MRGVVLLVLLVAATSVAGEAQLVPVPQQQRQEPQPGDTIPVPRFRVDPPVSPLGAAWRSMLIPGWGQSILGRRVTGAAFVFWEGVTLFMTIKSSHQLAYQTGIGAETVDSKRAEVQDWAVLLAFNHLLAAAEAYVSAQLWDFPVDLTVEGTATGDIGLGISLSF